MLTVFPESGTRKLRVPYLNCCVHVQALHRPMKLEVLLPHSRRNNDNIEIRVRRVFLRWRCGAAQQCSMQIPIPAVQLCSNSTLTDTIRTTRYVPLPFLGEAFTYSPKDSPKCSNASRLSETLCFLPHILCRFLWAWWELIRLDILAKAISATRLQVRKSEEHATKRCGPCVVNSLQSPTWFTNCSRNARWLGVRIFFLWHSLSAPIIACAHVFAPNRVLCACRQKLVSDRLDKIPRLSHNNMLFLFPIDSS